MKELPYIKPYSDIFVHYLLAQEQNKDLLIDFINSVLIDSDFTPIKDVTIKNPFNIRKYPKDREIILDINATDENEHIYNIEIQSQGNKSFINRALLNWAKCYSNQIRKGQNFTVLKPTISINILNWTLIEESNESRSTFLLTEKNNKDIVLTDQIIIHFLELSKVDENLSKIDNKLLNWLYYFKYEGIKEDKMTYLFKTDNNLLKAHKEYEKFRQNDKTRKLYHDRVIYEMDKNTLIESAKIEGKLEGKIEGEILGKQNSLIKQLIRKFGLKDEEIELIKKCNDMDKLDRSLEDILFFDNKVDVLKDME